jgi:catechol 2,3-dioxygenase-like lactoylglutathione lyase family enzyme
MHRGRGDGGEGGLPDPRLAPWASVVSPAVAPYGARPALRADFFKEFLIQHSNNLMTSRHTGGFVEGGPEGPSGGSAEKVIRYSLILTLLLLAGLPSGALPQEEKIASPSVDLSIYKHAIHVGWVAKDLDRVLDYWEKLGLKDIQRVGIREMPDRVHRGKKTRLVRKMAFGNIGGVQIEWMQPVSGESVNNEFLEKHGDGISHFAYAVASARQLDEQIEYFKARGVNAVEEGSWVGSSGKGRLAYLDTAAKGGGSYIELVYSPGAQQPSAPAPDRNEYPFTKIVQYAILVRDVHKVGSFYQCLGFGGMPVDHNISVNRNYRGQPAKFEMYLGWWHWPDVTFEWIQSLVGPSVYDEYLKAHGEGFHHLAFEVTDMDEAVNLLASKGAPVSQSGGWDSPGGRGRFAYLDTEPYGGVTIELLWNEPKPR